MPSLLVFTGVTTLEELLAAVPEERPDFLGADLRVLLAPYPSIEVDGGQVTCRDAVARRASGKLTVRMGVDPWDAVRAAAVLAWTCADDGSALDVIDVLGELAAELG
jgi:hypothetical protein